MTTPQDFSDEVTLTLKDGSTVTMRRAENGLEICHSNTCLTLEATAPEFLALMEFMETFQQGDSGG